MTTLTDPGGKPIPDGWGIDNDAWLWRFWRPGDPPSTFWDSGEFLSRGFREGRKVYAATSAAAAAWDNARIPS